MILTAPCRITAHGRFSIEEGNFKCSNIVRETALELFTEPQKKNPYRPGAQRPIGARGTKGDWRLPIRHNLQYWDVLVKKIIDCGSFSFVGAGFIPISDMKCLSRDHLRGLNAV